MRFLTFAGLLVILICVLYFARPGEGPELFEGGSKTKESRPPTFMREVELLEYRNDKIKWRFKAFEAHIYEDKNLIKMKKPEVKTRLNNSGEDPVVIRADFGEIKGDSQAAVIWGRARVQFADKRTLFAKRIFIDQKKQIIYTRSNIRMVSDQDTIKGDSMRYDLKTGLLTIAKPRLEMTLN